MILVQVKTLLLMLTFSLFVRLTCTLSKPEDFNLSQTDMLHPKNIELLLPSHLSLVTQYPQQFLPFVALSELVELFKDACTGFCVSLYSHNVIFILSSSF